MPKVTLSTNTVSGRVERDGTVMLEKSSVVAALFEWAEDFADAGVVEGAQALRAAARQLSSAKRPP